MCFFFHSWMNLRNNGSLPSGDKGRKRSKYCVTQRPKPNGVQPSNQYRVQTPQTHPVKNLLHLSIWTVEWERKRERVSCVDIRYSGRNGCESARHFLHASQASGRHRRVHFRPHKGYVSGNLRLIFHRNGKFVCYQCHRLKRFQIGRSSEEPIDFVVADTVPGSLNKTSVNRTTSCSSNGVMPIVGRVAQSTISRFACRLLVDRENLPARAYVYAAGFDSSRNIFLGVKTIPIFSILLNYYYELIELKEKATKWETDKGIDGLTTNGVLLLQPKGEFEGGAASAGQWVEVSVGGALYHLRDSRSAPQKKSQVRFD